MACVEEEIFGPIVSVVKFQDEIDCLEKANKGWHGLAAYELVEKYCLVHP